MNDLRISMLVDLPFAIPAEVQTLYVNGAEWQRVTTVPKPAEAESTSAPALKGRKAKAKAGVKVTKGAPRECINPECKKIFKPKHPLEKSCSNACRARYAAIKAKEVYDAKRKSDPVKPAFGARGADPRPQHPNDRRRLLGADELRVPASSGMARQGD